MNWFRKQDELNQALIWVGLGSLLIAFVFGGSRTVTTVFRLLFALCALFFIYRTFAAQPHRRSQQNMAFLRGKTALQEWWRSLKRGFRQTADRGNAAWSQGKNRWEERKKYRYLTCRQCGQKLRVPRGKGKIRVTCTNCRNQFLAKS